MAVGDALGKALLKVGAVVLSHRFKRKHQNFVSCLRIMMAVERQLSLPLRRQTFRFKVNLGRSIFLLEKEDYLKSAF